MSRGKQENYKIKSKTGFYIGDLCYALKDEIYDDIWGAQHNYEDGAYEVPDTGLSFAVTSTQYGDGYYPADSSPEQHYPVDAGIIGIAPVELCKPIQEWANLGRYVSESGDIFLDSNEYGTIKVSKDTPGDIEVIYTGEERDTDEDDYDHDTDDYDRRTIEDDYGLDDGELDGYSLREAEKYIGLEDGELDRYTDYCL